MDGARYLGNRRMHCLHFLLSDMNFDRSVLKVLLGYEFAMWNILLIFKGTYLIKNKFRRLGIFYHTNNCPLYKNKVLNFSKVNK